MGKSTGLYIQIDIPATQAERDTFATKGYIQKTIQHEFLHALGFSITQFQKKPGLVDLLPTVDYDGTTDQVWHFISGLPLKYAQSYFNCPSLSALPLMGENPLGDGSRGSHWETRIMADDVLTYSNMGIISDLSLSVYEELGFYLGNYSASGCMQWGAARGCAFVKSRCHDRSVHDFSQNLTATPGMTLALFSL